MQWRNPITQGKVVIFRNSSEDEQTQPNSLLIPNVGTILTYGKFGWISTHRYNVI